MSVSLYLCHPWRTRRGHGSAGQEARSVPFVAKDLRRPQQPQRWERLGGGASLALTTMNVSVSETTSGGSGCSPSHQPPGVVSCLCL